MCSEIPSQAAYDRSATLIGTDPCEPIMVFADIYSETKAGGAP